MEGTIRYVFGLIGAMVASLIIYGLFMSSQGHLYTVMNNQLGNEYLTHTGNNGQLVAQVREAEWNKTNCEYKYIAYVEE